MASFRSHIWTETLSKCYTEKNEIFLKMVELQGLLKEWLEGKHTKHIFYHAK